MLLPTPNFPSHSKSSTRVSSREGEMEGGDDDIYNNSNTIPGNKTKLRMHVQVDRDEVANRLAWKIRQRIHQEYGGDTVVRFY